jgi:hypothetical protein
MSGPVREPSDGASTDGPLNYAPKRVRLVETEPDSNPAGAPPKVAAAPRSAVEESTEPPWKRSKQGAPFVGDIAIREMRNKLALAPDRLPEPSPPLSTGPRYRLAGQHTGVVVVAALCAVIGYQWGSAPPSRSPQSAPSGQSNQQGLESKRSVAFPKSAERTIASPAPANAVVLQSDKQKSRDATSRTLSPRLMVNVARPQRADEAARLNVSAKDAGANATAVIGGLAPGSALSAGTQVGPNTWRLSIEELTDAAITPPLGFVGTMDLSVELHLANNIVVDRKALQMRWPDKSVLAAADSEPHRHDAAGSASIMKRSAPASDRAKVLSALSSPATSLKTSNCNSERTAADGPASDACGSANDPTSVDAAQPSVLSATGPRTILPYPDVRPSEPSLDASEIATKMKIGGELMAHGDITAARTMFQRAAEAGEAAGAFALAETYDPAVLRQLHLRGGIAPDLALARRWYEQARAMGSTAAAERIVRLTEVSR